jgi:hypothetical protein
MDDESQVGLHVPGRPNTSLPPKLLQTQLKHLVAVPIPAIRPKSVLKKPIPKPLPEQPGTEPEDVPVSEPTVVAAAPTVLPSGPVEKPLPLPTPKSAQLEKKAESLPVLDAFQQFLDVERKRSRSRMVTLTLVLIVVFVAVAAISLTVALVYTRQFRNDFTDMKGQVSEFQRTSEKLNEDTRTSLQKFDGEVRDVASTATDAKARAEQHDAALSKLQDSVTLLETQNDVLRTDLARLNSGFPAVSSTVEDLQKQVARLSYKSIRQTTEDQKLPAQVSRQALVMPIVPRGKTNAVPWRIPFPE